MVFVSAAAAKHYKHRRAGRADRHLARLLDYDVTDSAAAWVSDVNKDVDDDDDDDAQKNGKLQSVVAPV